MDNHARANWGLQAMAAGSPDYVDNDQQTNLTDVLSNLMHEARRCGLDFDAAVHQARVHYLDEVAEESPVGLADFPGAVGEPDLVF